MSTTYNLCLHVSEVFSCDVKLQKFTSECRFESLGTAMQTKFCPTYCFANDLSHIHHNSYTVSFKVNLAQILAQPTHSLNNFKADILKTLIQPLN